MKATEITMLHVEAGHIKRLKVWAQETLFSYSKRSEPIALKDIEEVNFSAANGVIYTAIYLKNGEMQTFLGCQVHVEYEKSYRERDGFPLAL